jgi:hypothetical protein
MKRHYFIGDDLDVIAMVEKELTAQGIAAEKIHTLSLDDAHAERRQLNDVQSLMKRDVIHAGEIGALIGLVASVLAIVVAHASGVTERIGWWPFVFLAIVLLGFFTWEGGLIGIQSPNSRFRRFEKALRAGEHVFFVDVEEAEEPALRRVIALYEQMRPAGTGSSSPRWLVGLQANARRFLQWAP